MLGAAGHKSTRTKSAQEFEEGQEVNSETIHFSRLDGNVRAIMQAAHIEASKSEFAQTYGLPARNGLQSTILDEIGWTKAQVRHPPFSCPGRLRCGPTPHVINYTLSRTEIVSRTSCPRKSTFLLCLSKITTDRPRTLVPVGM